MSTHANIIIPVGGDQLAHVYLHYDGYPQHVLPALNALTEAVGIEQLHLELLKAKELRSVAADEVEGFPDARPYAVHRAVRHEFQFTYQFVDGEWRLV